MFFNFWQRAYMHLQKLKLSHSVRRKTESPERPELRGWRTLLPMPRPQLRQDRWPGLLQRNRLCHSSQSPELPDARPDARVLTFSTSSPVSPLDAGRRQAWLPTSVRTPSKGLRRESSPHMVSWLGGGSEGCSLDQRPGH